MILTYKYRIKDGKVLAVLETLMLSVTLSTAPFLGELIATLGGAGVVTEMMDDWADALLAAS